MKESHTFQIVVMAVFGVLALAGLLLFASYSGNSAGETQAGTVVIWGTLPAEAIEAGLQELTASDEQYSDVTYEEKEEASWRSELADALASGTGPDLVLISQEDLLTQEGKLQIIPFATYPERTYVDTFVPIFELFLTTEGTYGIPLVVDPLVLFYNRTILSSENIATVPRTWEAVAGIAPAVSRRDDASAISRSTVAFGDYVNVRNARAILSTLLLQAGTPITTEGELGVQSALGERGIEGAYGTTPAQAAVSYYTQFGDPAKTVYSWNRSLPESRVAFLANDLALYPGFASELTYLMSANPNLDFDMALIPQPGTSVARSTYGKGYALVVPKATQNSGGAIKTALALSEPTPMKVIAEALSVAPARRELLKPQANDRFASLYYPEALSAKGWLSPSPAETDAIFAAMVSSISSGRLEVNEALTAAASAIDAALR